MRVIITAGGTGGHIYPALAILNKIKEMEPDSEFLYIGTHNRMEKEIVPAHGIRYEAIEIYGLAKSLKLMPRNIKNVFLIYKDYKKCLKLMQEFKPDIVMGFGGYVTFPVIKAANKLGIKTFIHEQNSIPGKANKGLLKNVDLIGVSFQDSLQYFDGYNAIMTGNPVSENALNISTIDKEIFGMHRDKKGILIVSGSLGSSVVNKKMQEFLESIGDEDYEVLYITGKNFYDEFTKQGYPKNVFIQPYVDNLSGLMKDMDLIISRAGASSVAEIEALRLPSILIPSPYVANNHQYFNAMSIVNAKAGFMIQEKDLSKDVLKKQIDEILNNPDLVREVKRNLANISIDDSSSIIYKEIKKII